jgi:hypothetical protein
MEIEQFLIGSQCRPDLGLLDSGFQFLEESRVAELRGATK